MSKRGGVFTFRDLEEKDGVMPTASSSGIENRITPAHAASRENTSQHEYKDCPPMAIRHIPHLSQANQALSMLRRIHAEFYPLVQRRGYRVVLLSEMCCCGDGNDYESNGNRSNKRRKKRVFSSNVLGYNLSRGGVSEIRIRLRHANNHNQFFSYEEIAGTMAHELAHCVVGPHNAKFYKLMDEILEQHAVYQVKGVVADSGGFPLNSRQAHVLGSTKAATKKNGPLEAALARQGQAKSLPPQRLGGKKTRLPPYQAAAMAAETRRLRDEQWCQPCKDDDDDVVVLEDQREREQPPRFPLQQSSRSNQLPLKHRQEVICLDDDDDAVDDNIQDRDRKPPAVECVDLTGIENTMPSRRPISSRTTSPAALTFVQSQPPASTDDTTWSCPICTLVNSFPVLVCCACQSTLISTRVTIQLAQDTQLKENEM